MAVCCRQTRHQRVLFDYDFSKIQEVDNDFFIRNDKLTYAVNKEGIYQLAEYDIESHKLMGTTASEYNLSNPFYFQDSLCYLIDSTMSGAYSVIGVPNRFCTNERYLKAYASGSGNFVLLQARDHGSLHLFRADRGKPIIINGISGSFNGACFSEDERILILSIGNELWLVNLTDGRLHALATSVPGIKKNLFLYGNELYYSAYGTNENYTIFMCRIVGEAVTNTDVVLQGPHDLRLPKRDAENLYYIEIVDSKYFLKRKSLTNGQITDITVDGIVYSYQITAREIIAVFSDLQTPRGIVSFNKKTLNAFRIQGESVPSIKIVSQLLKKRDGGIPAYVLHESDTRTRGIILYFHPGHRNDDYSPRWDNMIYSFCSNGFMVVAPNFPSSTGYGKSYERKDFETAVRYMTGWIRELRQKYKLPVYLYGISSGCILMEACANRSSNAVKGIISAFGLSENVFSLSDIPCLYVLGENDPFVPYLSRIQKIRLLKEMNPDIQQLVFPNEAHWIQHANNFNVYFKTAIAFLNENQ
jgi:hypothetical protein